MTWQWLRRMVGRAEVTMPSDHRAVFETQTLIESLSSLGFEAISGTVSNLQQHAGSVVLQKDGVLLKVTNDHMQLLFDVASTSEPEKWYLLLNVRGVLENRVVADDTEPTYEDCIRFMRDSGEELSVQLAGEHWPAFRARLEERRRERTAFLLQQQSRR